MASFCSSLSLDSPLDQVLVGHSFARDDCSSVSTENLYAVSGATRNGEWLHTIRIDYWQDVVIIRIQELSCLVVYSRQKSIREIF